MAQPANRRLVTEDELGDYLTSAEVSGEYATIDYVDGKVQEGDSRITMAPDRAGDRPGTFKPRLCLYEPLASSVDMGGIYDSVRSALNGDSHLRVSWAGHSIVAGKGATPGANDYVRLSTLRAAQQGIAYTGTTIAYNNVALDDRWTKDSAWIVDSASGPRIDNVQQHLLCRESGKSVTYRSVEPGTIVRIYTFSNGSALQYSIDGGTQQNITPAGGSSLQVTQVTGLSNTPHTVKVTSTTSATAFLLGISVTQTYRLEIANHGYSGAVCKDWSPTHRSSAFYNPYNNLVGMSPDVVVVQLGANEAIHSVGDLSADLSEVISALRSDVPNVIMVADPPVESSSVTTWFSDFYPVLYDIADAQKVPLLDFSSHWLSRAAASGAGLYDDQWHPNGAGYFDLSDIVGRSLLGL